MNRLFALITSLKTDKSFSIRSRLGGNYDKGVVIELTTNTGYKSRGDVIMINKIV